MEIDEAISIITWQIIRPAKFEESCKILLEEVKRIAIPVKVERNKFMSTLGYGIVYNREKRTTRVDPIAFAYNLRDQHKDTGIPHKQLIKYAVQHEKGHFKLQESGLEPSLPSDRTYMTLYARFEDYVISRFLENGKYRQTEKIVLRSDMKRGVHTFNDVCVSALRVALRYVKIKEIEAKDSILKYIKLISSKMNEIKKPMDAPQLLQKLFPEIKSRNWNEILLQDL